MTTQTDVVNNSVIVVEIVVIIVDDDVVTNVVQDGWSTFCYSMSTRTMLAESVKCEFGVVQLLVDMCIIKDKMPHPLLVLGGAW